MFKDREYLSALFRIALPIALSNLISTLLNAVGILFIGQLGEIPVAAVGLGNQIFFLLNLMLFGICSGSAIFTAQYWGSQDLTGIRKIVTLCLAFCCGAGLLFTLVALVIPEQALFLFTSDQAVIDLGARYLRIVGWSYLAMAVTFSYSSQLRAIGMVRLPTAISVACLSLGSLLTYLLVFGKLGLPAMGVEGAALATCLARLVECAVLVLITYLKKLPAIPQVSAAVSITGAFFRKYLVTVLPVFVNETMWSLGMSIYNSIYAHISTESVAAINITSTIENLAFVFFIGVANASAILIGNRIGAGEEQKAMLYARRTLFLGVAGALVVGAAILALSGPIISLYKVSETVQEYVRGLLLVLAVLLWIKVSNMNVVVGILRAGGDTRFSMLIDIGSVWLVGIPMALLGANVFHLPVYWVAAMVGADEITKLILGFMRYRSSKWVNNLAQLGG